MTEDEAPVSLSTYRAEREGDARLWTVADCLAKAWARATGERKDWTKCYLIFYREEENRTFMVDSMIAGCSTLEARGMLFQAIKTDILEDGE